MKIDILITELEQEIKHEQQRQIENLKQGKRYCIADVGDSVYLSEPEFLQLFKEGEPLPQGIKQYYCQEGFAEHYINAPRVAELIGPVPTNSDQILLYVTQRFFRLKNTISNAC